MGVFDQSRSIHIESIALTTSKTESVTTDIKCTQIF